MTFTPPAFDDIDREALLDIASNVTTLVEDEHLVVDNARALEAWVMRVGTRRDVQHRMDALSQAYRNLKRIGKLPMDWPEKLTAKAETFYIYLKEPNRPEPGTAEPGLAPVFVDSSGETVYIETSPAPQ